MTRQSRWNFGKRRSWCGALAVASAGLVWAAVANGGGAPAAEPLAVEDFTKVEIGKVPESFLILEGQFAVQEEGGNRFLELPGAPLESFAAIFGPSRKEDVAAQARFYGTSQGRRFPVFGVSLNGVGGYRLQVSPAKKAIELLKGDQVAVTAPFQWQPATWTQLRIQIRKTGESAWRIEGKAWKEGSQEPAEWGIAMEETESPVAGRPAVWGKPFAGTPIRFDDLQVLPVEKK